MLGTSGRSAAAKVKPKRPPSKPVQWQALPLLLLGQAGVEGRGLQLKHNSSSQGAGTMDAPYSWTCQVQAGAVRQELR
jgi:hypothetical protein